MREILHKISFISIATLFCLLACSKNIQVASVQIGDGRYAGMFLNASDSCEIKGIEIFSNAGKLAILNRLNEIYAWDITTGRIAYVINSDSHNPVMMKVSPDGKTFATCGFRDGSIKFWRASDGSSVSEISSVTNKSSSCMFGSSSSDSINAIEYTPDGTMIASADSSGNIKIWNVSGGNLVKEFKFHPQQSIAYNLKFDSTGEYLAIAGGETHYRQEMRTGTRSYCCGYSNGRCTSYCTQTYTYYVTIPYYHAMFKVYSMEDYEKPAEHIEPRESSVMDTEYITGSSSFIASTSSGIVLTYNTRKNNSGLDISHDTYSQIRDYAGKGVITSSGGDISIRDSQSRKQLSVFKTGEKFVRILKYFKNGGVIAVSGGNTVTFWDSKGYRTGLLSTIGNKNWMFVRQDGYYDGTPEGCRNLYWKIGDQKISLDEFDNSFRRDGLVSSLFTKWKDVQSFNIASRLVGKIGKISSDEILVFAPESSALKMGEKLFTMADGEKISFEVVFPMMTTAKCKIRKSQAKSKIRPGMPVFR